MMEQLKEKIKSESGVILMASTMGIFIIMSFFAFYLARFAATETRTGGYYTMDIKARNVAMTGLEHGIQSYKTSRSISTINGSFNTGNYLVEFDASNNESGSPLPHSNYIMMKSRANIDDVERNLRLFISSMPESFCFSYYGNNAGNQTFTEPNDFINGDMFYNGNVQANSGTNSGTTYTSTGVGGTLLSSPPSFPQLDITLYENLLTAAAAEDPPSTYDNYALDFNGSDYVGIGSSSDINTGIHSQRTIEAWFRTNNKDSSTRQVIYEEGGGARGLNIYIHSGRLYVGGWNRPTNESNWNPGTWIYTTSIQNNQWHHVALTLNGGSSVSANALKMYLDGNYTTGGNGSQLWGHNPANIGRTRSASRYHNGTGNGYTFNGKIDEVRIWNVERTAGQIAAKKDTIITGNESGLTAYYNFQENTGNTVNDTQTQSNNDGTNSGASWIDGPPFSKMIQSSYTNTTINLSSFTNSQKLHNGNLTLTGTTVNGPGYIAVNGNLSISSNTTINGNIFLICSGTLTIANSQAGTGLGAAVILYSKGNAEYDNSTIYGLIISKGSSLELDGTAVYGAILNYSSSFSLAGNSDVIGSVNSNYSVDIQGENASITKGNLPPLFGLNIGLDPIVVPGSYLEF